MEHISLLELLEQEKHLCQKLRGVEYTLGQMSPEEGGGLYKRLDEERAKAAERLPLVRVQIGAKTALYTQLYGESVKNALGILTGSAEEGDSTNE